MPGPLRLKGIAASTGYAEGPLFPLDRPRAPSISRSGAPHAEADRAARQRSPRAATPHRPT